MNAFFLLETLNSCSYDVYVYIYIYIFAALRRSPGSETMSQASTRRTATLSERFGTPRASGVKSLLTLEIPMCDGDKAMLPRWAALRRRMKWRRSSTLVGARSCLGCRSGGWTSTTSMR